MKTTGIAASDTDLEILNNQANEGNSRISRGWAKTKLYFLNFFASTYYLCITFFAILQITDQFNLYSYTLQSYGDGILHSIDNFFTPSIVKLCIILCFILLLIATYCRTVLIKNYAVVGEKLKSKEYAIQAYQQNISDERLKRVDFLRSILIFISKSLGATSNERISLYVFDINRSTFDIISRYSYNTKYNVRSRVTYPANEGCIAQAWQHGKDYYEATQDTDEQIIADFTTKYKIPKATANKFSMLPRVIYAYRIDDDNSNAVAVLVFESKSLNKYQEDQIRMIFEGYTDIIKTLVLELRADLPTLSTANEVEL